MAQNKFLGWSIEDLEAARRALQQANITGAATEITISGVRFVYDPVKLDIARALNDVQFALSEHPSADPTDPLYASPYGNKVMHTETRFQ